MSEIKPNHYSLAVGSKVVRFDTKEEFNSYVEEERAYCFHQQMRYYAAIAKEDREQTKLDLDNKRKEFAVKKGKFETNVTPITKEKA